MKSFPSKAQARAVEKAKYDLKGRRDMISKTRILAATAMATLIENEAKAGVVDYAENDKARVDREENQRRQIDAYVEHNQTRQRNIPHIGKKQIEKAKKRAMRAELLAEGRRRGVVF